MTSNDQVVFGTAAQIAAQMIRYAREKRKEKHLEPLLLHYLPLLLSKLKEGLKGILSTFGALLVLQELISLDCPSFFPKILDEFESDKSYLMALCELLNNTQNNKLEEMRKI